MAWGPRPGTVASSPRWKERTSRRMKPCRQLRSSSRQCPAFTQFLYSAQLRRTASSDSTISQPGAVRGGAPAAVRTRRTLGSSYSASVGGAARLRRRRRSPTQKLSPPMALLRVPQSRQKVEAGHSSTSRKLQLLHFLKEPPKVCGLETFRCSLCD